MAGLSRFLHPEVSRRLLRSEGEVIVDEVQRHWVTRLAGVGYVMLGAAVLIAMPALRPLWVMLLVIGVGLGLYGFYRIHAEYMDRFVITNMRVFRVHGVIDQRMATMPIARILDISVHRPFWGQVLGYGHFVFESAAQDQGLKRIRFVSDVERRDLTIQRVIQRAGLRARMEAPDDADGV